MVFRSYVRLPSLEKAPVSREEGQGSKKILLVSNKNPKGSKKKCYWYHTNYPQKPAPSSTIERSTFSTIAHQLLPSLTQMLIPMRRSPDCYCTYVCLSALMCGCMHVRVHVCLYSICLCMSMCEGTNIKRPAEGLQTQDVAVRVKNCAQLRIQLSTGCTSPQSRMTIPVLPCAAVG